MADGPTLQTKSTGQQWLNCPERKWKWNSAKVLWPTKYSNSENKLLKIATALHSTDQMPILLLKQQCTEGQFIGLKEELKCKISKS